MLSWRDRVGWGAVVWLVMLWGGCVSAMGQTAVDGVLHGVVVDASGAAVRGAKVEVEDGSTGFAASAVSDKGGEFLVVRVPVGTYRVVVVAQGFERLVLAGVVVEEGTLTGVDAHLRIAGVTSSVTVTAGAEVSGPELPGPESAAVATTVTPGEIERLPVNGRRWQTFALLTPTVNPDAAGLLSFRGLAVTQNGSVVDGADDDQSFGAVPRGAGGEGDRGYGRRGGAAYTFSQEAVREFRVSGQNYSAVYGHAAGGVVTTVSKSGTNALHGTAFYLARSSALAATNPFSVATHYSDGLVRSAMVKPHDLRQQLGGSVGGAAVRDRVFYFYTFDQQRRGFPAVSSPQDAKFYSLTPTQTGLLGTRGVTPSKVNAALNYLDSLTGVVARRQDQTVNFGKLEWKASTKNRLSLQYDRARSSSPGGVRSAAVVARGRASLGSSYVKVDSLLGRWLWTGSAKFSNEVRAAVGRDFQYEEAAASLPQEPAVGPGGYAPEVAIGPNGLTFGTPSSLGRKAYPDERRVQIADMVTWVHGHHQVQIGGDVSLVHDRIDSLSGREGAFHYDSTAKGHAGGLVDWITDYTFNVNAYPNGGCPTIHSAVHDFCFTSFAQSFGQAAVRFDTQEWAGYVQDGWQARRDLTIDAGVRYEYELLPFPQAPNGALDAAFGQRGATSVFPEDRNNFGPRLGVAWQPLGAGRGTVRLGYGLFYGRLPGATVRSALVNTAVPSSATHIRIVPGTVTYCPQVANQGFGYACAYLTTPPAAVGTTTSATVFDRGFRLPAVQQGSVALERTVGAGVVGSATYLMNLDRQLPGSVDMNIAPASSVETFQLQGGTGAPGVRDGEMFSVPVYTQRVDASYGAVTDIVSSANASYNALVLEARRRSVGGLEFRASWTWSKAIDYGQNAGATPRQNGQFDPFDLRYDKGLSSLNFPHKLVASAVWEPRVSSRDRWLRRAANGWMVAPLFTERSGRPYSLNIYGGARLKGGHQSINGSGGAVYLPTVGRNTLRLPDAANLDVRVSRTVRVSEKVQLKGVAEIFNVTNRVNYSGITQRAFLVGTAVNGVTPLVFQDAATVAAEGLNVQPFGAFTAASTGQTQERQVQLGLRLEF